MTILDRLSRLIRANVNDLIGKAEDPTRIIDQTLLDMREAYGEARTEVAGAMAQSAKLEREASTNSKLAAEYGEKAESALRAGSEDLAREALRRKQNHTDLAAEGKTDWEIGELMGISRHGADFHLRSARVKLGCVTRAQAVAEGFRRGLIV